MSGEVPTVGAAPERRVRDVGRGPGDSASSRLAARELVGTALAGLALGLLLALLLPATVDSDLWGHLRFGLDLLTSGGDPDRPDPYSYLTGGSRWINHETLAELASAAAFRAGGGAALVAMKFAVVLGLFALFAWRLRRAGMGLGRIALLLAPATVLLLPRLSTVRPQLFSDALFAATLVVLLRAGERRRRELWLLAPIMALWVNTHGAVVLGIGLVVLWAGARTLRERRLEPAILAPVALAAAALCVSPYGVDLPAFLLRTATVPRPDVLEWQPVRLASAQGIAYLLLLGATLAGWALSRRERRLEDGALFAAIALLPLMATRHTDLFAIGAVLLAGEHVADAAARLFPRRTAAVAPRGAVAAIALLAVATPPIGMGANAGCLRIEGGGSSFPVRAVATLVRAGVRANVAVPAAWGEYVIWTAGPRLRVSFDGRRETVYSDSVRERTFALMTGEGDWSALLRDGRTELVLARVGSPGFNLMRLEPGWTQVYADATAAIFARVGSGLGERIRATAPPALAADGAGLCLEDVPMAGRGPASGDGGR
ncbi:MAG: hypothetical protein IRZ00_14105 [Gemmatimonadetes bacterium]|nr:hypothetical protein [Gemmatimonadota bacterium]